MSIRLWLGGGVVLGLAVVSLAGCSGNSGYPIFDREPTSADVLPPEVASMFEEQPAVDLDSSRFAATHEGADLYLLEGTGGMICIALAKGEQSSTACGGGGGPLGVTSGTIGTFVIGAAPIDELDGWTVLSENIRVEN